MGVRDRLHDRQAESEPVTVMQAAAAIAMSVAVAGGANEWLQQLGQLSVVDERPGVGDLDGWPPLRARRSRH